MLLDSLGFKIIFPIFITILQSNIALKTKQKCKENKKT